MEGLMYKIRWFAWDNCERILVFAFSIFVGILAWVCWCVFAPTDCSRCGAKTISDKPYKLDGKPTINFCKRCRYEQAESFIRFCPVEE
jgi:hypothetical protein